MALIEPDLSGIPPTVLLGTSSWSAKDWEGVFYPERTPTTDYIAHYARRLSTVEVDSSFYGRPSASTVDAWARKTPPGFVFSLKVPQTITHEKGLLNCEEETRAFLDVASRLEEKLGVLVLQFPYVPKGKDPREYATGAEFLRRLGAYLECLPRGIRFAVEVRNSKWIAPPLLDLLRSRNVALVLSDYYTMPGLPDLEGKVDLVTADFAFVRFLGDRKKLDGLLSERAGRGESSGFDRLVVDRSEEMRSWVPALRRLQPQVSRTLVYFNNHYAGFGPGSVDLFARTWRELAAERDPFGGDAPSA